MNIEIISFGKIAELISSQKMQISDIKDTDELQTYLENSYPALSGMKYKLALNKNIIQSTQKIKDQDVIAIMPPFSGG